MSVWIMKGRCFTGRKREIIHWRGKGRGFYSVGDVMSVDGR